MSDSNETSINPPLNRELSNTSEPPSPRSGILKPLSSSNGKVNSNPNWKSPTEVESPIPTDFRKQVRHSIVSLDSTVDLSTFNSNLSKRKRCQRRLSIYLHTHVLLIIVSTLAILDAICVIGQLICDILIMKDKLIFFEVIDDDLTKELLDHLPHLNKTIHDKWNLHAILQVLQGLDVHHNDGPLPTPSPRNLSDRILWNSTANSSMELLFPDGQYTHIHRRFKRALQPKVPGHEVDHGVLYELTHIFHLGSMAILSMLLLETLLKVFAMGKKLKHHKLEIFDAIVVTISWCLDVGFWEGIWAHPGAEAATILIYLLPWRVVRIVNSFVLVIQEKEHVHLKIVKQRLRQSLKKSKESLEKACVYRHEVKALAGLCRKLGASESEVMACSPSGKAARRGSVQSVLERAASLTFISTLSNMGSLPSLFDMGDSSSEDEGKSERNDHTDLERADSHNPTLISAISSLTLDSNSINIALEVEDSGGYENSVFDNEITSKRSSKSAKDEEEITQDKPVADRTNSNDSVPPEYNIAVTSNGGDTHL